MDSERPGGGHNAGCGDDGVELDVYTDKVHTFVRMVQQNGRGVVQQKLESGGDTLGVPVGIHIMYIYAPVQYTIYFVFGVAAFAVGAFHLLGCERGIVLFFFHLCIWLPLGR